MRDRDRRVAATPRVKLETLESRTMLSVGHLVTAAHSAALVGGPAVARFIAPKPVAVKAPAVAAKPVFRVKPVAPPKQVAAKLPPVVKSTKPTPAAVAPVPAPVAPAPAPVVAAPVAAPVAPAPAPTIALLPGDANGDGTVDVADFEIVNDHMGQSGLTLAQGDVNGDGTVDFADFQMVEVNFGKVLPKYHYATIGQNLDGISDYGTIGAFGDLTRTFRQWGRITTPYQSDPTINLTADNYPLEDAGAMTYALTYPDGIYKVSWDGQADLAFTGMGSNLQVTSHVDDHWTADLSLNHAQGEILNVYVTNVNVDDPLHNLHVMSPDMDYSISDTFRPVFLQKLANFNGPLRMMDWMQTNWNPAVDWTDRTSPNRFSNTGPTGVDYETIIKLANTLHKDIWINVPYHASDDYVVQMGKLFSDNLDPSLTLYVENSNEVWNSGTFQQALDNTAIAKADPDITATDDFTKSAQEVGKQMVRVSTLFKQGFGADKFAQQVRPILGGFIATSYWAQTALNYIQDHYGPPKNYISAIAIAPYVGVEGDMNSIDNANLTSDTLFEWMNNFIDQTLAPWIQQHKTLADQFGLALYAYEGGQSLQALNGQNEALKQAAQDDPRMGDVYTHLIRVWNDNSGGGIFENFSLATPNTAYGYWGILQSITETSSVKWDAVMAAIG
jgi:hypothetical protein